MAEVVRMPKMSDTMTDGVLAKWHKKVGDKVKPGDVLAEVETDKATMDFESYQEGTLLFIGIQEGQSVPVDAIIAVLGNEGEDYKTALGEGGNVPDTADTKPEETPAPAPESTPEPESTPAPAPQPKADVAAIPATVIRMPALSDTMTEGVINKWNFKVGDKVKADDSLADVETDKATMEVVGYEEGTLLFIGPKEGDAAPVNGIIAIVGKAGTDISALLQDNGIQAPVTEQAAEQPAAEAPPTVVPAEEYIPAAEVQPAATPPANETPTAEQPAANDQSADEHATAEHATAEQPAAEQPAAEQPAANDQPADEHATGTGDGRIKASPLARRIAKEKGISLSELRGTADNGRIVKKDIEAYAKTGPAAPAPVAAPTPAPPVAAPTPAPPVAAPAPVVAEPVANAPEPAPAPKPVSQPPASPAPEVPKPVAPAPAPASAPAPVAAPKTEPAPVAAPAPVAPVAPVQYAGVGKYTEKPVSQMRKVIAKRLSESLFTAPHFYITMSIDMDQAIATRTKINESSSVKISFNDFVLKASAIALKQHPNINSSWLGDKIRYNESINIGVAVAVDEGLLVPVIRDADQKSLGGISVQVKDFAQKAKAKKLQPADWEGSTFTISNLGMFGVEEFTAIINPPDACILAVGGIQQIPVVKNNAVVPGNVMKVTLSCDHRVVDGATGAAFLQALKALLEDPIRLMV